MPGTVTVACKYPNGIKARLYKQMTVQQAVFGGGVRDIQIPVPSGDLVTFKGPAAPFGVLPKIPIVGGYALTSGIDADWFAEWLKQNETTDLVKNKIVFAHAKDTHAMANEHKDVRSGLEPLNTETTIRNGKQVKVDPRMPRAIEKADAKS
jgi:hypothetical protein